jgi:hypothetical protein
MKKNCNEKRPSNGVERSCNINLEKDAWLSSCMKGFRRSLNQLEIILNKAAFYEGTLSRMYQLVYPK